MLMLMLMVCHWGDKRTLWAVEQSWQQLQMTVTVVTVLHCPDNDQHLQYLHRKSL